MKIQVFGSGCASCKKLYELIKKVVTENKIEAEIEYVTDVQKMIDLGLVQTPAMAINEKPVLAGFVPNEEQIKELIEKNSSGCCGSGEQNCCCGNC